MKTRVDNFSKQELEEIVNSCTSMRSLLKKLGYQSTGSNHITVKKKLQEYNISIEHFTGVGAQTVRRTVENVFMENSTANQATLRRWYISGNYTEYKCAICGLPPFWNGKELVLTLDHINGNHTDNRLENLRWVCPNCDRQLDTFAGKNIKFRTPKKKKENFCIDCGKPIGLKATRCHNCHWIFCRSQRSTRINSNGEKVSSEIPDKEYLEELLIKEKGQFKKIGEMFGVCDNSVRKWCKKYGLPFHTRDYKPPKPKKETIHRIDKIIMKNTNGETIKIFKSRRQASAYIAEIRNIENINEKVISGMATHIGQVCNGLRKTAYGYQWECISQLWEE